ncbi:hypothetical protein OS493_010945 [Desmophyllum pertusum]|uniref:Uncharacterized protein n=1 Tax=Desmophyllum pertusum TaxID=174260 RepID=A0A9W9ZF78_9CNID|nr:hypothetical protein OS493_010945 [Desmophyllum pertusum]
MSLNGIFMLLVVAAVSYILITAALVYVQITAYRSIGNEEMFADFTASTRMTTALPTLKPFIYLTQTEECLPSNLVSTIGFNATQCNCDVIVLSYQTECTERKPAHVTYLFDPQSTWASGRNMLYFTALSRERGYHYYIFMDDDVTLTFNEFTPPEMKKVQPFRAVEEWLLDYEPAVGVLDYTVHHGAKWTFKRKQLLCHNNEFSLVLPTVRFDAIFHAFHYKAIGHILPYITSYDEQSWWVSALHIMAVFGAKIPRPSAAVCTCDRWKSHTSRLSKTTKCH